MTPMAIQASAAENMDAIYRRQRFIYDGYYLFGPAEPRQAHHAAEASLKARLDPEPVGG
jgi:hypothetical protein